MTEDREDIIDCMARMKGEEIPFAVATVVRLEGAAAARVGSKAVIRGDGEIVGWIGGGCTAGAVRKAGLRALVDGKATLIRVKPDKVVAADDGVENYKSVCPSEGVIEVFIEPVLPRPALLIAGASPVARALADLADRLGHAVTVAALPADLEAYPDSYERMEGFDLSRAPRADSSFIVVATQGRRDKEALKAALATGAPYVAFVGSRKKGAAMKQAMAEAGVDKARIAALRSPAGIHIGAHTPEEIALSILAEIVQERRMGASASNESLADIAKAESQVTQTPARETGGCCGH
jgi:xanthine dehydrogenase accessory factor